jgi:alpha-D-ribose 1-methylphosphonate 5-triphosphate synthase subunit PhnG
MKDGALTVDTFRCMTARATEVEDRQEWLRLLACSPPAVLAELLDPIVDSLADNVGELRRPEVGLALVTGRVGSTGQSFGLGEMTLARCVVHFGDVVGVGYVRGRQTEHARRVAVADALLQTDHYGAVSHAVLTPLADASEQRRRLAAAEVEATRVQFLTMVRGN